MKVDIKFLNFEMCHVSLTETPTQGLVLVCAKDAADREIILGRFEMNGKELPISIPMGFDRVEDLERLVFHEYNGDNQRSFMHKLNLSRWLVSKQMLHASVYRTKPAAVKRVAAVTIAYNEDFILPKWVDYYGRQVGEENLFIIDDGSDRKPRSYLPAAVNVVQQPRTSFDSWRLSRTLGIFQHLLLETYDVVIVTDSDEFIVVSDPAFGSLRDYLWKMDLSLPRRIIPTGWDLTHMRSGEPAVDLTQPIVRQRKALLRNVALDKVAILSDHVSFTPGQHQCFEKTEKSEVLDLVHLRYFDYEFSRQKLERYRATEWAANDLSTGLSYHQRKEISALEEEFDGFEKKYVAVDNAHANKVLRDTWIEQLEI